MSILCKSVFIAVIQDKVLILVLMFLSVSKLFSEYWRVKIFFSHKVNICWNRSRNQRYLAPATLFSLFILNHLGTLLLVKQWVHTGFTFHSDHCHCFKNKMSSSKQMKTVIPYICSKQKLIPWQNNKNTTHFHESMSASQPVSLLFIKHS